jgi:hypothetical protein
MSHTKHSDAAVIHVAHILEISEIGELAVPTGF